MSDMNYVKDALAVSGPARGEYGDESLYYRVGSCYNSFTEDRGWVRERTVTRITISDDLPGLHCNLVRWRVWDGDTVIAEGPAHGLEVIEYYPPELAESAA